MASEPTSMTGLLQPGFWGNVFPHFGLDSSFDERFYQIVNPMLTHIDNLLISWEQTGEEEQLHECYMLKTASGLIDEYVKPTSPAELACCAFLVGKLLQQLETIIMGHQAQIQTRNAAIAGGESVQHPTQFYGSTATA